MKCTKHTRYYLQGKTDQCISVNNILGIKLCLVFERTKLKMQERQERQLPPGSKLQGTKGGQKNIPKK